MAHRVIAEGAEGSALKKSIEIVIQDENIENLLINIAWPKSSTHPQAISAKADGERMRKEKEKE